MFLWQKWGFPAPRTTRPPATPRAGPAWLCLPQADELGHPRSRRNLACPCRSYRAGRHPQDSLEPAMAGEPSADPAGAPDMPAVSPRRRQARGLARSKHLFMFWNWKSPEGSDMIPHIGCPSLTHPGPPPGHSAHWLPALPGAAQTLREQDGSLCQIMGPHTREAWPVGSEQGRAGHDRSGKDGDSPVIPHRAVWSPGPTGKETRDRPEASPARGLPPAQPSRDKDPARGGT